MYPCATGEEIGCCNRGAIEIGEPNALCCWCFQNQKNSGGHYSTLLWSTSLENSEWSNSSALSASTAASAGAVVKLLLQSKISRFLTCPLLFPLVGQQFLCDLLRLPIVSKSVPCKSEAITVWAIQSLDLVGWALVVCRQSKLWSSKLPNI